MPNAGESFAANHVEQRYLEECANHLDKQTGQHQNERTLNEILFLRCKRRTPLPLIRMGIAAPCPILQYDASNRIMLQLCATGRAVCVILAARFAAVRARRYRAHFRQLVAQRMSFSCLASTCAIFFVHSSLVTSAPRVQIVHQLADFLVQCFALGVQIENLQVDAGRQCKVVRLLPATPAA